MLSPRELKIAAVCVAGTVAVSAATTSVAASYVISRSSQVKPGVLQVSHLSKRAQAALKGRTGAKGARGPSNAYSISQDGLQLALDGTFKSVAQLTLPKGAYVVVANATLDNQANATASGQCRVVVVGAGTVTGTERLVGLDTDSANDDIHPYTATGVLAPTNAPVVQLQCKIGTGSAMLADDASLLAVQVAAFHQG